MNADNVGQVLDALAARFGSTGAHLWVVLQHQAYVEFYTAVGFALLVLCGWIGWILFVMYGPEQGEPEAAAGAAIILGIATVAALLGLGATVQGVANPEYYALHEILKAIQ